MIKYVCLNQFCLELHEVKYRRAAGCQSEPEAKYMWWRQWYTRYNNHFVTMLQARILADVDKDRVDWKTLKDFWRFIWPEVQHVWRLRPSSSRDWPWNFAHRKNICAQQIPTLVALMLRSTPCIPCCWKNHIYWNRGLRKVSWSPVVRVDACCTVWIELPIIMCFGSECLVGEITLHSGHVRLGTSYWKRIQRGLVTRCWLKIMPSHSAEESTSSSAFEWFRTYNIGHITTH